MSFKDSFKSAQLSFENLSYRVEVPDVDEDGKKQSSHLVSKQILNDISAVVKPGEMLALMGSSGAGKSTLLEVLTGKIRPTGGSLQVNGHALPDNYAKLIGYVTQSDLLMGSLTVRETLSFYAALKMPGSTEGQRAARVDKTLVDVGLLGAANTLIGDENIRGVSGGEKRRVSIAIELLNMPSILFLDEPTSGLDSFTSLAVMETVRKLAESGRTIVCTIHQPRASIFNLFDKLLLLSHGETVYYGPSDATTSHFEGLGHPCPQFENPADFVVDLVTVHKGSERKEGQLDEEQVRDLVRAFHKSDAGKDLQDELSGSDAGSSDSSEGDEKMEKCGFFNELKMLLWRNNIAVRRNPLFFKAMVSQIVMQSILVGLTFLQLEVDQTAVQGRLGFTFFAAINAIFGTAMGVVSVFPAERDLVRKERSQGAYTIGSYFWAKTIGDLPVFILMPFLFSCIAYWMVDVRPDLTGSDAFLQFLYFIIVQVAITNAAQALGSAIGAAVPNAAIGNIAVPGVLILQVLFGGFLTNLDDVPVAFIWISWISTMRWAFQGMIRVMMDDLVFTCVPDELVLKNGVEQCPVTGGNALVEQYQMDGADWEVAVAVLFGTFVLLKLLTFFLLKRIDWELQGPNSSEKKSNKTLPSDDFDVEDGKDIEYGSN